MAASISTSGTQGTGDSYWRQPHSLFEIASSYSRVYVSSELRLEGEPTCVGYNGRVVSVADGSTLRIYTLEKTYPYTKEPARVVLRGTVDFACRRFALTGRFLVGLGRERLQVVRLSTQETIQAVDTKGKAAAVRAVECAEDAFSVAERNELLVYVYSSASNSFESKYQALFQGSVTFAQVRACGSGAYYAVVQCGLQRKAMLCDLATDSRVDVDTAQQPISACGFNPHISGIFALGTLNGDVHVYYYSATSGSVRQIALFCVSAAPVLTTQFSPSHPDVILAAGRDGQARLMRYGFKEMTMIDFSDHNSQLVQTYDLLDGERPSPHPDDTKADKVYTGRQRLIFAAFDQQNILSVVFATNKRIVVHLLNSSTTVFQWLKNMSTVYIRELEHNNDCERDKTFQNLQNNVYQQMYKRDMSAAVNVIFESVEQFLNASCDIVSAEKSFLCFRESLDYITGKSTVNPDIDTSFDVNSAHNIVKATMLRAFQTFPSTIPQEMVIQPTVPDQLLHQQYSLRINLLKQVQIGQTLFDTKLYNQCYDYISKNKSLNIRRLVENLLCYLSHLNDPVHSTHRFAYDIIQDYNNPNLKQQLVRIVYRVLAPSIFCDHLDHCICRSDLFKHVMTPSAHQSPKNSEEISAAMVNQAYKPLLQLGGSDSEQDDPHLYSFVQKIDFQNYLAFVKLFRGDYLVNDNLLMEHLPLKDLIQNYKITVVDQATFLIYYCSMLYQRQFEQLVAFIDQTQQICYKYLKMQNASQHQGVEFISTTLEIRSTQQYDDLYINNRFYCLLCLVVNRSFWETILTFFQDQLLGDVLELEAAQQQLDLLLSCLKRPFITCNLILNTMSCTVLSTLDETPAEHDYIYQQVVGWVQRIKETFKITQLNTDTQYVEYCSQTVNNINECMPALDSFGMEQLAARLIEITRYLKGQ